MNAPPYDQNASLARSPDGDSFGIYLADTRRLRRQRGCAEPLRRQRHDGACDSRLGFVNWRSRLANPVLRGAAPIALAARAHKRPIAQACGRYGRSSQLRLDNPAKCSSLFTWRSGPWLWRRRRGWKGKEQAAGEAAAEGATSMRRRLIGSGAIATRWALTRGPSLPPSRLESRLMRPACGSRSGTIALAPPTPRQVGGG